MGGNGGASHPSGGSGVTEENRGAPGKYRESRSHVSSTVIEQLKQRDRNVELGELTWHIREIAQDQYGSRLIQQKLEVASDEEKQLAFLAIIQNMPQLTTDVFGNYVIQKFFEYGSVEQRRILAEQLVGQVLKLSLQMYGCRVVQKALDSVPIEQQVLLVGELRGHIIQCIEDQHGNYVVQHTLEHSTRGCDRQFVLHFVCTNILPLSCHKYASNVVERALLCGSLEERASVISAILGDQSNAHPPLVTMMRDRFGNYIVQRTISLAQGPQRSMLFWRLETQMPLLRKSSTYGKHIIAALQLAQSTPAVGDGKFGLL